MTCPDFDDLLTARAEPGAHAEVLAHAGRCPQCARTWAALALLDAAPAAARWPEVPPALSRAARAVAHGASSLRRLREALARLVFDSAAGPAAAVALRGAGPAARHLQFEAGALQLDLAVLGGDTLVGQLDGAGEPSAATCLLAGPDGARWTPLESNGDFRFERVVPGRYLLAVETDDQRLLVPDLDLSA